MVSWGDYLFTATVRAIGGGVLGFLGCLVGGPYLFRARFLRMDKPTLLWIVVACTVAGAVLAVVTIPRWKTPWYKGHDRDRWE